jgi:transcriptional regulator with XRE-family HTH domain
MTQEALAEKLGCGVEAVSRMERGAIMPTLPRLIETAEALSCPAYELLGVTSDLPSDQAIDIAKQLEQVLPSDREMLLGLVGKLTTRFKI